MENRSLLEKMPPWQSRRLRTERWKYDRNASEIVWRQ
jgi:hypothetical protein